MNKQPNSYFCFICGVKNGLHIRLKSGQQRDFQDTCVGNIRADPVHAVGGGRDDNAVLSRLAKNPDQQVDGFVAAVAQKNMFFSNTFNGCNSGFQLLLQRIRVPVKAGFKRVFIGIQKNGRLSGKLAPGGGIRLQVPDIGANEGKNIPP